jgi:hypothetical protein
MLFPRERPSIKKLRKKEKEGKECKKMQYKG